MNKSYTVFPISLDCSIGARLHTEHQRSTSLNLGRGLCSVGRRLITILSLAAAVFHCSVMPARKLFIMIEKEQNVDAR